jgi:hypothetical protein
MNGIEKKYEASKAQGILKEYGDFLLHIIDEIGKEYDSPINEDTAEKVGLEYARRLAGKNSLKLLMQKLNSKSNERN